MNSEIKRLVVLTFTEEEYRKAKNELDQFCGTWGDEKLDRVSKGIDEWLNKYFNVLV